MSHWLGKVWIQIRNILVVLLPLSCSCGESCLLVSWCVGGRCDMTGSDEDRDKSSRFGAENRGWLHMLCTRWPDDRKVEWRYVRSAPYTRRRGARISWLSLKTRVDGLSVVWPQNHRDNFLWFGLKTGDDGSSRFSLKTGGERLLPVWPQNWWQRFLPDWPQNRWWRVFLAWVSKPAARFDDLCIKITATVSWFRPQN
jgi:hypothetical protein